MLSRCAGLMRGGRRLVAARPSQAQRGCLLCLASWAHMICHWLSFAVPALFGCAAARIWMTEKWHFRCCICAACWYFIDPSFWQLEGHMRRKLVLKKKEVSRNWMRPSVFTSGMLIILVSELEVGEFCLVWPLNSNWLSNDLTVAWKEMWELCECQTGVCFVIAMWN